MKTATYHNKIIMARRDLQLLKAADDYLNGDLGTWEARRAADAVAKAIDDLTAYIDRRERIIGARNEAAARAVRSGGA